MVALISHPFRIGYGGQLATVEENTDAHLDQHVQLIIGTHLGEREMAWAYGVPQLAWAELTAADIQTVIDLYGPDNLTVDTVFTDAESDLVSTATVLWSRDDDQDVT